MRRDTAAMAARNWPDTNYQFSRFRDADSRTRGPRQGLDAIGEIENEDEAEDATKRRSPQWQAAEALFSRTGAA